MIKLERGVYLSVTWSVWLSIAILSAIFFGAPSYGFLSVCLFLWIIMPKIWPLFLLPSIRLTIMHCFQRITAG